MAQDDINATEQSKLKSIPKGTVICREGVSDGGGMYVLLKGSAGEYINYNKPSEHLINALHAGSFYGEISLFLEKKRESTLVALSDCVFLQIGRDNMNEFLKNESRVVYELIKTLCSRLYEFTGRSGQIEQMESESDSGQSASDKLFPEGHGRYILPKLEIPSMMLYDKTYACPVCGKSFKTAGIRASKLVQVSTDSDLRVRYKDIEPLYYDIIICPECYYSALSDSFAANVDQRAKASIQSAMQEYKTTLGLDIENRSDSKTVFASYYMAMRCVQIGMSKPELTLGKLWLKVSRVYDDCEDKNMSDFTAKKAMDLYYHAYMNSDIPPKQTLQLQYLLGVLCQRFGDLSGARKLLYQVKIDKTASKVIRRLAEDRIDEIKES